MPFAANIDLSSLNGTNGFQITGAAQDEFSGRSVASAGDVNGDGIDDLIIGAYGAYSDGYSSGASYVVFGTRAGFQADFNLSTLTGTNGFRISGVAEGDFTGWSVASVGDVNGDGFDDLVIGAVYADPNDVYDAGASYVVFGSGAGFPANLELSALTGTNGFRISGVAARDASGFAVASAGDVNGDGFDDVFIGANYADPFNNTTGAAYVVFGSDLGFAADVNLSSLTGANGFRITGANLDDYIGRSIASAGDINGDGIDDLVLGAAGSDLNGANSGMSFVVFGTNLGFAASINLSTLNGTNGFYINGEAANDLSGVSVASAGDVNGDNIDDLIIGAWGASPNGLVSGASYVVFGKNTGFGSSISLSALNGTNGFKMSGVAGFDLAGGSVASAGDVNDDGFDDLIIGAQGADPNGERSGASYVVFGSGAPFAANINLGSLNGTNGFKISGVAAQDLSGFSVASAGDVNGDGVDDLIIGAYRADPNGNASGASYVIFGRLAGVVETGTAADDTYTGGTGDDTLSGAGGADILTGNDGADLLDGGDDKDQLYGGAGADDLVGGADGDLLDGGAGADDMAGGLGDDTYVVDDLGDTVSELATQGIDRVRASITYTLGAEVENLTLTGAGNINGTGNGLANQIEGNSGNNILNGGGGNDIIRGNAGLDGLNGEDGNDQLHGGDGNDELYGGDANDILSGGADDDTLYGGAGIDTLDGGTGEDIVYGEAGNDQLQGGDGNDQLFGGGDNDVLRGGAGNDTLTGGLGDDTYVVDDYSDTLVELSGQGSDIVKSTVTWTLAANFERLILEGSADINGTGNGEANQITGNGGANTLDGGSGNDILNGGLGNDTLIGGLGADTLTGGGGADTFLIRQESVFTSSNPGGRTIETDNISDYAIGQDEIDLSAIDAIAATGGVNDAFSIVGAFNGNAGQMTVTFAGSITTVLLDIDGDAVADYRLRINGDATGDTGGWLL